MMKDEKQYTKNIGKKYKIILYNKYQYTGLVVDECENVLIIKDKFGHIVNLAKNGILVMEEIRE